MRTLLKFCLVGLAISLVGAGCRSCEGGEKVNSVRYSIYDAVQSDLNVIANDLEVRALNRATSTYTESVALLEVRSEQARNLLRDKARKENTDPEVYEAWLRQLDSEHDNKLAELGRSKDLYLSLWQERWGTLYKDAAAVNALKQHEKYMVDEAHCKSGLFGFVRQITGRCGKGEVGKLDVGAVGSVVKLGVALPAMLP